MTSDSNSKKRILKAPYWLQYYLIAVQHKNMSKSEEILTGDLAVLSQYFKIADCTQVPQKQVCLAFI